MMHTQHCTDLRDTKRPQHGERVLEKRGLSSLRATVEVYAVSLTLRELLGWLHASE